jgi:hypothetical protein
VRRRMTMWRMWSRGAAIALVSATLLACGDGGTEPEALDPYFPLEVGNSWTYAPEDPFFGEPFEWRVSARSGDTTTVERPPLGSHSGPVRILDYTDSLKLLGPGQEALPFYRFTLGDAWAHRDPWECDDQSEFLSVPETEPVVTPAGTFTGALRIERQTTSICADAGTIREWWVRGVGLVQWEELNFYAGGPLTFSLVSYSVH